MKAIINFQGDHQNVVFTDGSTVGDLLRSIDINPANVTVTAGDAKVSADQEALNEVTYVVEQATGKVG